MNTQNYWNSILSSTSLRTLSTPLALYCKSYLAVAIGSGDAVSVFLYGADGYFCHPEKWQNISYPHL